MIDVEAVLAFLSSQDRPVERAWAHCLLGHGSHTEVLDALASYQNADGGFGRGLEVDIAAPDSQPFAARLAMHVLIDTEIDANNDVISKLSGWLDQHQDADGCWRLPETLFAHPIASWFAAWTFPSLNPALCLAGAAIRLGIGTPRLFARVAALASSLATAQQANEGAFYEVLPYAEFFPWVSHPRSVQMIAATAAGITNRDYDDAGHFFEHLGPANGALAARLDPARITAQLDRLEAEQTDDGGWPSPYSPTWRPRATAHAVSVLRSYGRLPGA